MEKSIGLGPSGRASFGKPAHHGQVVYNSHKEHLKKSSSPQARAEVVREVVVKAPGRAWQLAQMAAIEHCLY
jgi:hypothetical protein